MCWRIFVTSLKNVSIITLYTCLGHLSFSGRGRSSVEFYLQHLPVFSPPELCLCSNDRSAGWQGLWEGRSEDGHQQWGLDAGSGEDMRRDTAESKREVRELRRDSPGALLPAEQGKGARNKNAVRWQLGSAFETSPVQDTTFPAALQGWKLLCYHKGRAKGCTLLLGASIRVVTLLLGTKQGKLIKLLQYHTALVLGSDPTDKCSACKHLTK